MKRNALALAALVVLSAGEITAGKAMEGDPGGVYVGRHRYQGYDRDRYYGSYNRFGGDSCGMWRDQCALNWGSGRMFDICMHRRAAVAACGGY